MGHIQDQAGFAHGVERGAVDRDKLLLALPREFDFPCLSGVRDHYRKHVGLPSSSGLAGSFRSSS